MRSLIVGSVISAWRATVVAAPASPRRAGFDAVYTLVDEADHPDESFLQPGRLLRAIGARLAERLVGAGV